MIKENKTIDEKSRTSYIIDILVDFFRNYLTSIVIFGSYARGNYTKYSDLDVIIVLKKDYGENLIRLRSEFILNYKIKLDIHIFTEQEVKDNFNHCSPLFTTLLLGKTILFDRNMFFRNEFNKFARMMKYSQIKYCEGGKIWEMKKIARDFEQYDLMSDEALESFENSLNEQRRVA